MAFEGYTQETLDFLWGIRFNNERGWFMAHKEDYQAHLLRPTRELGEQVYEALHEKYPKEPFMLKMSRIYRDARRLHGQGPYKDHLWFCIRTGFWAPKASLMEAYRKGIDENPETLAKLVRRFNRQTHFVLAGPEYARSKGEVSELLRPWYQKKSVNLQHELPPDERIFSPELAQDMIEGFEELMPFYKYFDRLCAAQTEK